MKKIFYFILLGLSILAILFLSYGIFNTGVSLKYETNDMTQCISLVSGKDLCFTRNVIIGLLIIFVLALLTLLAYRKKIFK